MRRMDLVINKAMYALGSKCKKAAWLEKNHPELKPEAESPDYEDYRKVSELLPEYFGDCAVVVNNGSFEEACNKTISLVSEGATIIVGASFLNDKAYGRVAALRKNGEGYDIVELSVGTRKKEEKYTDYAYHTFLARNSGVLVNEVYLIRINNKYKLDGTLDVHEFLVEENISEDILPLADLVNDEIEAIKENISKDDEPNISIGCHCDNKGKCAYWDYCTKDLKQPSIFKLNGSCVKSVTKHKLYSKGVETMQDLVDFNMAAKKKDKVSDRTYREALVHATNTPNIDKTEIDEFLSNVRYPVYHMDFESVTHAIPIWQGENPYRQVCFQYSIHIEHKDGTVEHKEFLAKEGEDPRRSFAESLCADIPMDACVTVYNQSFEKARLSELSEDFPDLAEHLLNIRDNVVDLMIPFSNRFYYTAEMKNSYSIKYVLPALCPGNAELDYHALEGIHIGTEAADAFKTLAEHTPDEIAVIRKNLLAYCELDTFAMVKVLEKLREAA